MQILNWLLRLKVHLTKIEKTQPENSQIIIILKTEFIDNFLIDLSRPKRKNLSRSNRIEFASNKPKRRLFILFKTHR